MRILQKSDNSEDSARRAEGKPLHSGLRENQKPRMKMNICSIWKRYYSTFAGRKYEHRSQETGQRESVKCKPYPDGPDQGATWLRSFRDVYQIIFPTSHVDIFLVDVSKEGWEGASNNGTKIATQESAFYLFLITCWTVIVHFLNAFIRDILFRKRRIRNKKKAILSLESRFQRQYSTGCLKETMLKLQI